jgi:hypothetical protein
MKNPGKPARGHRPPDRESAIRARAMPQHDLAHTFRIQAMTTECRYWRNNSAVSRFAIRNYSHRYRQSHRNRSSHSQQVISYRQIDAHRENDFMNMVT